MDDAEPKGGRLIAITGTCASGKSSIAEVLMRRSFAAIDGDCVTQTVKHKLGVVKISYNTQEMYDEIALQIDMLLAMGGDVVLAHVITLADIDRYREMFRQRGLRYQFFVLRPEIQTAIERSWTRTCHTSITPEEWVRFFDDEMQGFQNCEDVRIFDNGGMTAEESADWILGASGFYDD